MNEETSKPWYREAMVWVVLAPLILVLAVCSVMVTIAVKYADDTVSDTYYKDGRAYNYIARQDKRSAELGLAGMLQFDRQAGTVDLDLTGQMKFPQQLLLTLGHPLDKRLDQQIILTRDGSRHYRGKLLQRPEHRWYVRLLPELDPDKHLQADWHLKGTIDFDQGDAIPLNPVEQ
ncbi:FixH family protein [Microbulbifer sp. SAOS-129_SWC]|uniref:FixH family protein n=1 Tax=Microbulbifer sp. SAOS-129_SWC TaxID=3145235 RepID=UPI0032173E03